MSENTQIAVVGAGLSGLLAALTLSNPDHGPGLDVTLIDAGDIRRASKDGRVTALTPSAMRMLARLGVAGLGETAMSGMRVGEGAADTPWQFELPESDDAPLAFNVENAVLRAAILQRLSQSSVTLRDTVRVESLDSSGLATMSLSDGTELTASLVIAADGRNSALRRLSGLSTAKYDFQQRALVTTITHAEPHDGIALQRFQSVGAVASLPLATTKAGHRSQIVWSDRAAAIEAAINLPEDALIALIDERLWHALDVSGLDASVQTYPLITQRCETLTAGRVALIGDAARVIHPLAGQGFNLAVRDIAALAQTIGDAVTTGQDIGTAGLMGYQRWRDTDETTLGAMTTALASARARGPLSIFGHARRAAFAAVDELPSLQALIRREAGGEIGERPALLR